MLSQTGVRFLKPECVWPRQTQAKRLFKQAEETGETVLFLYVEHHLRPSLAPFFVWFSHRSPLTKRTLLIVKSPFSTSTISAFQNNIPAHRLWLQLLRVAHPPLVLTSVPAHCHTLLFSRGCITYTPLVLAYPGHRHPSFLSCSTY